MEKVETRIDVSEWDEICIGYHSAKVPKGFREVWGGQTHVDHHYISVHKDYVGSARSLIESHYRYGGATYSKEVNGWTFVIAREAIDKDSGLISDFSLIFYGAKIIGNNAILVTTDASVSIVGTGEDPKYHAFYNKLKAEPITKRNRSKGFCVDGYVFLGYEPQISYDFWVDYIDLKQIAANSSDEKYRLQIWLSAEMITPPKDERKVFIPGQIDFEKALGLEVENLLLDHHGRKAFLEIVKEPKGDAYSRIWYRSFTDAPYGNVKFPFVNVEFQNDYVKESDSRAQMFTILDQIQEN